MKMNSKNKSNRNLLGHDESIKIRIKFYLEFDFIKLQEHLPLIDNCECLDNKNQTAKICNNIIY